MSRILKDVGSSMKLWGALAVQLLAVVLRDQHRQSGYPWTEASEPLAVQCVCECPAGLKQSSEAPSTDWSSAGLIGGFGIATGFGIGALAFRKKAGGNETEFVASRRRGGGVLSEPEEWKSLSALVH